jgi:NitT/TauT family transport system permease protein
VKRKSVVPGYARRPAVRAAGLPPAAWTGVLVVAGVLAVEAYARFGDVSPLDLVPVNAMVREAIVLLGSSGFVTSSLLPTLITVAVSFALSALLGVAVAWTMVRLRWWRGALQPYLNVFYAVPVFALYPIIVVLFGTGLFPVILLATSFSVVAVIAHAVNGFESLPPVVAKLSTSLRLSGIHRFWLILLPSALPDILSGLKLGLSYTIIAVLASEFILAPTGLGGTIATAYNSFETAQMYAGLLFVIAFALLANAALGGALSRFDWRRR